MTASAKEVIAATQVEFLHGVPVLVTDAGATAILAALDAAGFVIVPREPTKAMVRAAWMAQPAGPCCDWDIEELYRAMIAAQERKP